MVPIIIKRVIFLIAIVAFAFTSCQTTDPVGEPEDPVAQEAVEPEMESEPEPEPEAQEEEEFVVTEEIFEETFQAVEEVILELNSLIRAEEYDRWLEYLTDEYVEKYRDPEVLAELSQSGRLQNNGIVLESLFDFFIHVVVPSRANLRLDDLVFIEEDQVEAIMLIRDQRVTVYRLRLIENELGENKWKIEN
jgi:hypothetical protein